MGRENAGSPESSLPFLMVSSHSTTVELAGNPIPRTLTVSPLRRVTGATTQSPLGSTTQNDGDGVAADAVGTDRNADAERRKTRPALLHIHATGVFA
jgi:hypothetical protein